MPTRDKALERLTERFQTLNDLYRRGIVQGSLFKKQIRSLMSSKDAMRVFSQDVEPDRRAIKILSRIENPEAWRVLSMKSTEERETSFYMAIERIMKEDLSSEQCLYRLLQLACLPFYSSFLPLGRKNPPPNIQDQKPSRVSVLD
jgi:hypothetical protein